MQVSVSPIFNNYGTNKLNFRAQNKATDDKEKLSEHEMYAKLAKDSVNDYQQEDLGDYVRIGSFKDSETGFRASIYKNDKKSEIVISYRCTDNQKGVESDIQMVEKKIPDQYYDALVLYKEIKSQYPDYRITLTGHSLGASLAELIASSDPEVEAITFEGFGVQPIIDKQKSFELQDYNNCTNYVTKGSIVSSTTPHPGTTNTIYAHTIKKNEGKILAPKEDVITKNKHSIDNFTNLKDAKFSNETTNNIKREIASQNLMPGANVLLKIPGMKQVLPKIFFSDDKVS